MYTVYYTNRFEKDLKRIKRRSSKDLSLCLQFLKNELAKRGASGLPKKYKPHKLVGNYQDNWECHVKPDLLIIWMELNEPPEIKLIRVGTHADLF